MDSAFQVQPVTAETGGAARPWEFFPYALFYRAGFPYQHVERLRCEDTTALFEVLTAIDSELSEMRRQLLRRVFPEVVRAVAPGDRHARAALSKWRRRVAACKSAPDEVLATAHARLDLTEWNGLLARRFAALRHLVVAFERDTARAGAVLRAMARDEAFQEAVFSTNPNLAPQMLERLGRRGDRLDRVVLGYLQRAVAKTDTACSLGCTNFAELSDGADTPFARTVARTDGPAREVFFAFWAVRALADAVETDPAVRPFLVPALRPDAVLEPPRGVRLTLTGRQVALSEEEAATLRQVDGKRTVGEIGRLLAWTLPDVVPQLDALVEHGVIALGIQIPSTIFHPFNSLVSVVAELPKSVPARGAWLHRLRALDELRTRYRDAPLPRRIDLLAQLELAFTAIAGIPARRRPGEFYADRCITYEERQARTGNCTFGRPLVSQLGTKLQSPLALCAAYGSVRRRCARDMMRLAYDAYVDERHLPSRSRVSFTGVVHKLQAMGRSGAFDGCQDAVAAFESAWEALVARGCDASGAVSRLTSRDLDQLLSAADREPASAHAAVDILLAARDETDLQRGAFQIIVGEVGENVYVWGSQFYFCADRVAAEQQAAAAFRALPDYRPFAVILAERMHKGFLSEAFPGVIVHAGAGAAQRAQHRIDIRDLQIELVSDELEVLSDRGGPYQFFHHSDELVHLWAFAPCRIAIPPIRAPHRPRVEIDGVVLKRREWIVPKAELLSATGTGLQRFRHAWTARLRLGIPERVFVHISTEIKPFHIDFASYHSVRLLEHVTAREHDLRFVEMLPGPEEFWLHDDVGSYATEFRLLALRRGV